MLLKERAQTALRIKPEKLFAEAEIDKSRMSPAPFEFGDGQSGTALPLMDQCRDHFHRNCRMVHRGDEGSSCALRQFANATGDRSAHFTFRIRIERECHWKTLELPAHLFTSVAHHDDNRFDSGFAQSGNTVLDDSFVTEGK